MLVADGILVNGGVGLGCAVVRRRDAVTGFTSIVAVPVVHGTVWVIIYTEGHAHISMAFATAANSEYSRGDRTLLLHF